MRDWPRLSTKLAGVQSQRNFIAGSQLVRQAIVLGAGRHLTACVVSKSAVVASLLGAADPLNERLRLCANRYRREKFGVRGATSTTTPTTSSSGGGGASSSSTSYSNAVAASASSTTTTTSASVVADFVSTIYLTRAEFRRMFATSRSLLATSSSTTATATLSATATTTAATPTFRNQSTTSTPIPNDNSAFAFVELESSERAQWASIDSAARFGRRRARSRSVDASTLTSSLLQLSSDTNINNNALDSSSSSSSKAAAKTTANTPSHSKSSSFRSIDEFDAARRFAAFDLHSSQILSSSMHLQQQVLAMCFV